ncbi:hypothetical protein V6N13_068942 [Hibiscus sabdariffa]|uniref:F-box domain-containing protein n=1 Tax=Hibiscus sabdariffa TaxID=183260 RepID=A0ABR2QP26_9ROSI
MAILPHDVTREILCRLGVKDLLRFRCVSKPWLSLIDDPDFIKLHLSHSLKTNSNFTLVLGHINPSLFSVDFYPPKTEQTHKYPVEESHEGKFIMLLGSCNGLLALSVGDNEAFSLWNPWTGKSQMLPTTGTEFPPWESCRPSIYLGFGYDPISDDYKLVRITQFYGVKDGIFATEVKVYSLRTNSWRRIKDFPFHLSHRHRGVLVNNALHWEVSTPFKLNTQRLVAAFDLGTEEYRLVELPDCLGRGLRMDLYVVGGCLCLVVCYGEFGSIDIWIMKEHGVKESWTKLISIKYCELIEYLSYVVPVAFSRNGRKVLLKVDCKTLVWLDLRSSSLEKIASVPRPCIFVSEMMVKSLVPLNGNGTTMFGNENHHGGKKRKRSTTG